MEDHIQLQPFLCSKRLRHLTPKATEEILSLEDKFSLIREKNMTEGPQTFPKKVLCFSYSLTYAIYFYMIS